MIPIFGGSVPTKRALSAGMRDPKMQSTQLRLAESYDKIARLTEERLRAWSDEAQKSLNSR
jgi:hypothetical protein